MRPRKEEVNLFYTQPWLTQGYGTVIVGGQSSVTVKERGGLRRRPHQSYGRGPAADDEWAPVAAGGGTGIGFGHVERAASCGLVCSCHGADFGRERMSSAVGAVVTACPLMAVADHVVESPVVGLFCSNRMDGLAGIATVP